MNPNVSGECGAFAVAALVVSTTRSHMPSRVDLVRACLCVCVSVSVQCPFEGALATVRARRKLWVHVGPLPVIMATIKRYPGKNKNDSEASGIYWQPYKKPRKTGLVLAT